MDTNENLTAEQIMEILLGRAELSDRSIWMRALRGEGPRRFIEMSMVPAAVVHAIWRDDSAPGGFSQLIVSGEAHAGRRAYEERYVFQVPDEMAARLLAASFGDGRIPGPWEPWEIYLLIRDRDGGCDAHGRPKMLLLVDAGR